MSSTRCVSYGRAVAVGPRCKHCIGREDGHARRLAGTSRAARAMSAQVSARRRAKMQALRAAGALRRAGGR